MSCENCSKGNLLPGEPSGKMVGDAYFVSGSSTSTRAIILLTDAFGLPLKNSKIIADNLAKRLSCDVWVPDIFDGEPIIAVDALEGIMPERAGVALSFTSKLKLAMKLIPRVLVLYRQRSSIVDPRIHSFIRRLKEDDKYDNIGAVGYCFGGSCAVRLGSTSMVNSIVICHPGACTAEEVNAIKVPASWACAEEDMSFNNKNRQEAERLLSSRKGEDIVEYEFHDYRGTVHGFAARPNLSIPEVKAGYEGAFEQTVNWFNKTLPA